MSLRSAAARAACVLVFVVLAVPVSAQECAPTVTTEVFEHGSMLRKIYGATGNCAGKVFESAWTGPGAQDTNNWQAFNSPLGTYDEGIACKPEGTYKLRFRVRCSTGSCPTAETTFQVRWDAGIGVSLGDLTQNSYGTWIYPLTMPYTFFNNGWQSNRGIYYRWLPTDDYPASSEYLETQGPNDWEGTWVDAVSNRWQNDLLLYTPISCGYRFEPAVAAPPDRDTNCTDDCSNSAPDAFGDPVRAKNGGMQYRERDPLPQIDELPLVRTYESWRTQPRWFGLGWASIFDAWMREIINGNDKIVILGTEDFRRFVFQKPAPRGPAFTDAGVYRQLWPVGAPPATLTYDAVNGIHRLREHGSDVETSYRTSDGRVVSRRHIPTNRSITITWATAPGTTTIVPTQLADSWGNWSWAITTNATTKRISQIDVTGTTVGIAYTYDTAGNMTAAKTGGGANAWRTYVYASNRMTEARDAVGNVLEKHAYDSSGRATTSYGPSAEISGVTYDGAGRVTGEKVTTVTAASGAVTKYYTRYIANRTRTVEVSGSCASCGLRDAVYAHDAKGRIARQQDERGYITVKTYTATGEIASVTSAQKPVGCDPATDVALCRQTPDALATVLLEPTSVTSTTSFTYADTNWPERATTVTTASVANPGQQKTETMAYDAASGRVVTRTTSGWISTTQQQSVTTTTSWYDGVAAAEFAPGGVFDTAWLSLPQPKGQLRSVDGPLASGDVSASVYYPVDPAVPGALRGRLAATRNAHGHITRFENYDAFGNAQRLVDANGVAIESTFDDLGRVLTTTVKAIAGCDTSFDPLCATDLTTTRVYTPAAGPLATEQRPGGGVTKYEYDTRGRVTTTSRGPSATDLRERIANTYDTVTGLRTEERLLAWQSGAWVEKKTTKFEYDTEGRLVRTLLPPYTSGHVESTTYGAGGVVAGTKDARHAANNTRYSYDAAGRVTKVEQLENVTTNTWISTQYAYDIAGNLTSVTDPNGNVTTYQFDDFGRMTKQTSAVTGITTYAYDVAGNLTSTSDANGATTTRTYDGGGRMLTAVSSRSGAATETVTYAYDESAGVFGVGRMTKMTDPSGNTTYKYDRRGLLTRESKTLDAWLPNATLPLTFTHDADGNRATIGYPSGQSVQYTHDYGGRQLTAAIVGTGSGNIVTSAAYLPFGPPTQIAFANGTTHTMQYDTRYRMLRNQLTGSLGTIADYQYGHDASGNITSLDDAVDLTYNRAFGYDALGRLITANSGTSLWGTGSYTYDAMGNMLTLSLGTSRQSTFTLSGTTPKLTSVLEGGVSNSVSYDSAGNETAYRATRTYTARNSLASVASTQTWTFGYDGRGIRVARSTPTATRYYAYSPELQFLATTQDGTTSIDYEVIWFAGAPVAQVRPFDRTTDRFTFTDHLGTPLLQTTPAATIAWRAEHEPFGNVFTMRTGTATDQPLRFPGQEVSLTWEGTEENYNIFRWYRSGWGRYNQADPIGLAAGMNLYAYVDANPVNDSDPWGLIKPVHPSKQKYRPCNGDEVQKCQASCKYGMESCMVSQTFKIIKMTGGKTLYGWVDGPMSCACREPGCWDQLKEWADPKKWFDPNPTPPLPPLVPIPPKLPTPKPVIPGLPPFFVDPCLLNPSLCYGDRGIA